MTPKAIRDAANGPWEAFVEAEQARVSAELASHEAERQVGLKTVASFWARVELGGVTLREHPHFNLWTDRGRCWVCHGPVVAMFGYELLDGDIPDTRACSLWLTDSETGSGMSRRCNASHMREAAEKRA